ncbi:hypothetical protein EV179_006514, partial [Coemansia sp. RSA 487]
TGLPFKSKPRIVKTDAPTKSAVAMDKKNRQVTTLFNGINFLSKNKAKKQKKKKQKAQKQQVEHMKKRRAAEEEAHAHRKKKRKSFF